MIRYALACDKGHVFESWFQNSAAYGRQAKAALITCPVCNSAKVEKTLMTPGVVGAKKRAGAPPASPSSPQPTAETASPVAMMSPQEQEFRKKLKELRDRAVLDAIFRAWRPSLFAGFMGALASQFWFLALALATAASVRTLALVEVLFAQAISRFVFKQAMTTREAAGIVLIVIGVALLLWAH